MRLEERGQKKPALLPAEVLRRELGERREITETLSAEREAGDGPRAVEDKPGPQRLHVRGCVMSIGHVEAPW